MEDDNLSYLGHQGALPDSVELSTHTLAHRGPADGQLGPEGWVGTVTNSGAQGLPSGPARWEPAF